MLTVAVADPGFPRLSGGANPRDGGANLLFWRLFPENCKLPKKKKIVWERHPPTPPPPWIRQWICDWVSKSQ